MGRSRKKSARASGQARVPSSPVQPDVRPEAAEVAADISLPPWLEEWYARHGAVTAVCGLLVLLVAIVFGQTLRHDFIDWDDPQYVVDNPQIHAGLSMPGIAWAFTNRDEANWHPLTWISHMLDWQMYGSWAGGHHLTSVLLHALTAILLFLALRRMTDRLGCSALVAVLFAIHPLRLPLPAGRLAGLAGWGFWRCAARYFCRGDLEQTPFSLSLQWLVLVRGNARSGDRFDAGRRSNAGGPLHLFAADRALAGFGLGG
jgi:hypothetical protein